MAVPKSKNLKKAALFVWNDTNKEYEAWDGVLNTGDIEIGAVELKDGDSDTRADIETDGTKNALYVQANNLDIRDLTSASDDVSVTTVKPDGTNTMPSMDTVARAGFQKITDGVETANVTANNELNTLSSDYGLEVARGNIAGQKGFGIPGRRDGVGTTVLEDITQTGNAVMPRPAGANLDLVFASGNDTSAGSGVQSVEIEYLDSNGDEQVVSHASNGGTVSVGTGMHDIQWIHADAVGAGGVAAGNITLVDNATGAIVYEQINAGGNQSLTARYKIPNGKTGYILGWQCSAVTRKIDIRLRADVDRFARTLQSGVFNFQDAVVLEQVASGWIPFPIPLKCPALSTIKISAISFTGTGDAGGQFDVLLIDD